MQKLPDGFNASKISYYESIIAENVIINKFNESGDLFDFVKYAIYDEKWRISNQDLFDCAVTKLEQEVACRKLSAEKIREIVQISERILNNNTPTIIVFSFRAYQIKIQMKINIFLLKSLPNWCFDSNRKNLNINSYTIINLSHNVRIELAKVFAFIHPQTISQCINDFKIDAKTLEGKKALVEIAKIAAQTDGYFISENIKSYGIDPKTPEGQQVLIEIAKIAAVKNPHHVFRFISRYEIDTTKPEGEQTILEIAKRAVQGSISILVIYITDCGIDVKKPEVRNELIEIFKCAVLQDAKSVFPFIKKFGIDAKTKESRQTILDMTKLALQQGVNISKILKRLKEDLEIDAGTEEGQELLIEIAKLAAQKNGLHVSMHIQTYGIDSPSERLKILILAFQEIITFNNDQCKNLVKLIPNFSLPDQEPYPYSSFIKFIRSFPNVETKSQLEFLKSFIEYTWPKITIDEEIEAIKSLKNQQHQQITLNWLTVTMLKLASNAVNEQEFNKLKELNFFKHVLCLRDPFMRDTMTNVLIDYILNSEKSLNSLVILSQTLNDRGVAYKDLIYSILSSILLIKIGLNQFDIDKLVNEIESKTIKTGRKKKKQPMFLDYSNLHVLLKALDCLGNEPRLSPEIKGKILISIFSLESSEQILKSLIFIKNIDSFAQLRILIDWKFENDIRINKFLEIKFQATISKFLSNEMPLEYEVERFENTFGQSRVLTSFQTYIAALNRLLPHLKKPFLELLTIYMTTVLKSEDAFRDWRYSEDDVHLKKIFSINHSLREGWKMNTEIELTRMLQNSIEENPSRIPNFEQLVLNSVNNNHISISEYPYLEMYLGGDKNVMETLSIPKNASQNEKQKIIFQMRIISLCKADTVEKQQKALAKLEGIDWLPNVFIADIQSWKNGLINSERKVDVSYKGWTVKFTDDPYDLFLCGTEIEGSCQNVNGDILFSKCLLAYVVNGKNKLVEIKDANGKIKARAVIRLLLDEQNNPVLFLERIYPAILPSEQSNAIIQMAKDQAARMKLPLLGKKSDQNEAYPYKLISLGGKAPYEYVDAISGMRLDGKFEINGAGRI